MITGLIDIRRPADTEIVDGLIDTLACLVEGVAAGLVADAVIIARERDEALAAIAEGSGASFLVLSAGETPWREGARLARREWLLCLNAGDIPCDGWIRVLDRFVGTARPETALGRLRRPHAPLAVRAIGRVETFLGSSTVRAGDVVRRDHLLSAGGASRRFKPRTLAGRLDRA